MTRPHLITCTILLALAAPVLSAVESAVAEQATAETGIIGGLALHVGTVDGKLEAALAADGRFLVRGLALDEGRQAAARQAIVAAGARYLASIGFWPGSSRLPPVSESVNLLIADLDALGDRAPSEAEILRVLVPGERGAAWLKRGGSWQTLRAPFPEAYDGWTQHFHDAQGTDFSRDTAVAPSEGVQYLHSYHGTSSNQMRIDQGLTVMERFGDRDPNDVKVETTIDLLARDTFNGLPLWVEPRPEKGATSIFKLKPLLLHRGRIATVLRTTPGERPVFVDATTGASLGEIRGALPVAEKAGGRGSREGEIGQMVVHGEVLFQALGNEVVAIDWASGERLWHFQAEDMIALHFPRYNPEDGELYVVGTPLGHPEPYVYHGRWPSIKGMRDADQRYPALNIFALDGTNGRLLWRTESWHYICGFAYDSQRLVIQGSVDNGGYPNLSAFDTRTGEIAFDHLPHDSGRTSSRWKAWSGLWGHDEQKSVLVRNGRAFLTGQGLKIFDITDGALLANASFLNSRCEQGRGAANFICGPFSNFIDIRDLDAPLQRTTRTVARGSCAAGYIPAHGMLHYLGTPCGCANFIRASVTLHPRPVWKKIPDDERLVPGPAYGQTPDAVLPAATDWPEYLGGPGRNSNASGSLGIADGRLTRRWSTTVVSSLPGGLIAAEGAWAGFHAGRIEAPVVAGGVLVAVDRDAHMVIGYDADTGTERWRFTADARVITPPTLRDGYCVFGGRDGWFYNLRASDGALVWRYLVAPNQRQVVAHGQLENAVPAFGAVPVIDGIVVASAGRNMLLDGGIRFAGLDLASGEPRWQRTLGATPPWEPLHGQGPLTSGEAGQNLWSDEGRFYPAVNRIQLGILVADGGTVGGDYFHLDAATGEAESLIRSRGERRTNPAPRIGVEIVPGDGFLNERWGPHVSTKSANTVKPGALRPYGSEAEIDFAFTPAFDREVVVAVANSQLGLVPTAKLTRKGKTFGPGAALHLKNVPLWTSELVMAEGVSHPEFTASVLTPDAVLLAYRHRQSGVDVPMHPSAGGVSIYNRKDGAFIQHIDFASAPMRGGLAVTAGRLHVACEDGSIHTYGAE